jgi:hypothetical protein
LADKFNSFRAGGDWHDRLIFPNAWHLTALGCFLDIQSG